MEVSRLQFCVHMVGRAVSRRSAEPAWIREMQAVIGDLEELNRTTEADFLAIGGNLMAFLTASRQLHSEIAGLTALVSGEHARHACDALVSVRGLVREMQNRTGEDDRAFSGLHAAAGSIHSRFSSLGKIALSFQITAILARIETAHLALFQQDLGNLADQVSSCGSGIQARTEQVLEAAAAFDSRISSSGREVSRVDAIQQQELPTLLAAVDGDLEIFEARQNEAAAASQKLSADLSAVARDLEAIAVSIQFHDITRQQVEHVIQALKLLLEAPAGSSLSASAATQVRLQKAHLTSAASAFCDSTRKIDRDLEAIAARVAQMAAASKCILGTGPDEAGKDSFLGDMQRRFEVILATVGEWVALEAAARGITAELDGLNRNLRDSVNHVQTIELQLSRIAINAAISASHIGTPGDPLNVVAGAMQSLQKECADRSREAEADLESIGKAIASLAAAGAAKGSRTGIVDNLDNRLRDLRCASASSVDAAGVVAARAETLCASLQAARDHSGIGRLFAGTMERCYPALDSIASQAQSTWSFEAPVIEQANHYTMQSERDIHAAVIGSPSPEEAPAPSGEDVEFF